MEVRATWSSPSVQPVRKPITGVLNKTARGARFLYSWPLLASLLGSSQSLHEMFMRIGLAEVILSLGVSVVRFRYEGHWPAPLGNSYSVSPSHVNSKSRRLLG